MTSILSRLERLAILQPFIRYGLVRLRYALVAYIRLVGISLVGAGPIVGALWTWAHVFDKIAAWPF